MVVTSTLTQLGLRTRETVGQNPKGSQGQALSFIKCLESASENLESPLPENSGELLESGNGGKENQGSHLPGMDEVQCLQGVGQPEVGQSFQLSPELQPGLSFGSTYQTWTQERCGSCHFRKAWEGRGVSYLEVSNQMTPKANCNPVLLFLFWD